MHFQRAQDGCAVVAKHAVGLPRPVHQPQHGGDGGGQFAFGPNDDQRRGGSYRWPAPRENYVYEGLQGALTQAILLSRQGYDVWNWSDRALLRAFTWLHKEASFPAGDDDTWQPHVINTVYGTAFPAPTPSRPGKVFGWTDWAYAR